MIGAIVVTLIVFAIVGSYMAIVNRMLRSDEHWGESNAAPPVAKAPVVAQPFGAVSPSHA